VKKTDGLLEPLILMLKTVIELKRCHDENTIHGDAADRNIFVVTNKEKTDYSIHLLDFGMTYAADGLALTDFNKYTDHGEKTDMAPERLPKSKLKAHPAQDIYTLSVSFSHLINDINKKSKGCFSRCFPELTALVMRGRLEKPWQKRPSLDEYIAEITRIIGDSFIKLPVLERLHIDDKITTEMKHLAEKLPEASLEPALRLFLFSKCLKNEIKKSAAPGLFNGKKSAKAKQLDAARFLEEKIKSGTEITEDELKQHGKAIAASKELKEIYDALIAANLLSEEKDFVTAFTRWLVN
jgi:serine/threonine protein kinase